MPNKQTPNTPKPSDNRIDYTLDVDKAIDLLARIRVNGFVYAPHCENTRRDITNQLKQINSQLFALRQSLEVSYAESNPLPLDEVVNDVELLDIVKSAEAKEVNQAPYVAQTDSPNENRYNRHLKNPFKRMDELDWCSCIGFEKINLR